MDVTVWELAQRQVVAVDRRETRAVRRTSAAIVATLVLILLLDQFGLLRPGLRLTGSAGGSADTSSATAQVELDVTSRGVVPERLVGVEVDYPGLTVTDARLDPATLTFGEAGVLVVRLEVDCSARLPDGRSPWDEDSPGSAETELTVRTDRPWGTASRSMTTGLIVQMPALACEQP